MSYGIRQSVKNKDVGKIGNGKDILFSSELHPFSVFASGEFSKHFPGGTEGVPSIQETIIEFDLDYTPLYLVFAAYDGASMQMPFYIRSVAPRFYIFPGYLKIIVSNSSPFEADSWGAMDPFDYTIYWMIFSEPNTTKIPIPKPGEIISTYYDKEA